MLIAFFPSIAKRFAQHLYVRVWLAVVSTIVILTLLVAWIWNITSNWRYDEAVVLSPSGQVLGHGFLRKAAEPHVIPQEGSPHNQEFVGPEFIMTMNDAQVLHFRLPKPTESFWGHASFGFFSLLLIVASGLTLATYPIIRKLTRQLEALRKGAEHWGKGDLSVRVPVQGNDEVAFLTRRFNTAAERIEKLVNSHKLLLANASHELRSPLARIRMGLELLSPSMSMHPLHENQSHEVHSPQPHLPPWAQNWHTEINNSINELDQLIDEILLSSRLDSPETDVGTFEQIDLLGLIAEESSRLKVPCQIFSTHDDWLIHAVSRLLRRLMRNLLENAQHHGHPPQGGAPQIMIYLERCNTHIRLIVADRGPGVPPEAQDHIFEPFYTLPGAREKHHSSVGLGLPLVRSIAHRHGGSIRYEDNPGGGARFIVTLPAASPRHKTHPAP